MPEAKAATKASARATAPAGTAGTAAAEVRADARLRRIEWTVFKRLDGLLQGDWRTFFRGHGLDLAELREYQHHDDVRRIDWNVTARLNQPFVREYLEDREATAWFLLDLSPSIDFGTRARKREHAVDLVAVLATALVRKGHRVGAHLYGRQVAPLRGRKAHVAPAGPRLSRSQGGPAPSGGSERSERGGIGREAPVPARSGRRQVLELMQRIGERPRPALVQGGGANGEGTRLDRMLHAAHANLRGRCVVFVVSDFISAPGWDAPLGALARRHDVVAVRIVDPAEREMPDVGLIPMVDAETGERMMVDTSSAKFRERYAKAAARREAQVHESLARAGVDTLELDTGENLADALLRFVHARRERARSSAGGATRRAPRNAVPSSSTREASA